MYKLIALDLDDTLLGHDTQISLEHKEAIARARALGCEITLVTARSWRASQRFVSELGLTAPVICTTGATIYSANGDLLSQISLDAGEVHLLTETADRERWAMRLYFADGTIVQSRFAEDFMTKPGAKYNETEPVGDLMPFLANGALPLQVALQGNRSVEGALALLPSLPNTKADAYERLSPSSRLHMVHRSVNKGDALAAYCARYGYRRESVIAMGDSIADLPMIAWAGCGVAMGWAPPEVRQAADLVAPPDTAHPVAWALNQLLAGGIA